MSGHLPFALRGDYSNHQDILGIIARLAAEMLDLLLIPVAKIVKPQAVGCWIENFAQFDLQAPALCRAEQALENRVLHTLAVIDALLGNLSETFFPAGVCRIDIIGNQDQHAITSK